MSSCILSKKSRGSNVTLLKDGLTINLPCKQTIHEFSLEKESSGSLVDVHVSIL